MFCFATLTLSNDSGRIKIQALVLALTRSSYLHKTVSGVGVEVVRRVFFESFGEGGMRRHHSALNIRPWWSGVSVHIRSLSMLHY